MSRTKRFVKIVFSPHQLIIKREKIKKNKKHRKRKIYLEEPILCKNTFDLKFILLLHLISEKNIREM